MKADFEDLCPACQEKWHAICGYYYLEKKHYGSRDEEMQDFLDGALEDELDAVLKKCDH